MNKKVLYTVICICVIISMASVHVSAETNTIDEFALETIEDMGDRYDDNIFVISFPNAEFIHNVLKSSNFPEIDIELITETGVDISLSLKNETKGVDSYTIEICECNTTDFSGKVELSETKSIITTVIPNTVYLMKATLDDNGTNKTYIGTFGIGISENYYPYSDMTVIDITEQVKYQNSIFADEELFDEKSCLQNDICISYMKTNEYVFGYCISGNRYFRIKATENGFIDIVLYTPYSDGSIGLTVSKYYEGNDISQLNIYAQSVTGNNEFEYVRFYAFEGEEYLINVQNPSVSVVPFSLRTVTIASPVWFPQWITSQSGVTYWDGTYMSQTYFKNSSGIQRIFYNGTGTGSYLNSACVMCCFGMVANAKGKTATNMFDIRLYSQGTTTGTLTTMMSDPYSVFLASNSLNGTGLSYSSSRYDYTTTSSTPYLASAAFTKFNVSADSSVSYTPISYSELLSQIRTSLSSSPDGVFLIFNTHTILVRNIDGYIRVFDTGRSSALNYSQTTSYYYNVPINTYFNTNAVRNISDIIAYREFN